MPNSYPLPFGGFHVVSQGTGNDRLLKSLNKPDEGPERKAALRQARAQLRELHESNRRVCIKVAEQLDEMQSPENLAALTAPRDDQSLLMQRTEDSSLRQLWRLMNMLFRVRNGVLSVEMLEMEIDPAMCMKTKDRVTKCPAKNTTLHRKMQQLSHNRQQSEGFSAELHRLCDKSGRSAGLEFSAAKGHGERIGIPHPHRFDEGCKSRYFTRLGIYRRLRQPLNLRLWRLRSAT